MLRGLLLMVLLQDVSAIDLLKKYLEIFWDPSIAHYINMSRDIGDMVVHKDY